jgi:TatD DNase family protein
LIDTHAHLDLEDFDADRGDVIARAAAAGVEAIICPAISAASSAAVVRLGAEHQLFAAVGIHPNSTAEALPGDWDEIVRLAGQPRVVALGETGLDRYWNDVPFELQQDYFERHLWLGQERDLAVIMHCRDAHSDLLPMLRAAAAHGPLRGVIHAMSGDEAFAAECLALGLYISFAGNVTYTNKKFQSLRAVARTIPADRLLIETDCPYLTPEPLRGRVKRNEPANVVHTAAALADLRNEPLDQLASQTAANARRLFCLP